MVSKTRTTKTNGSSPDTHAVDPCVVKLEALWDAAGENVEALSKSLRLFVFYIRTTDGVPERYGASVRKKIVKLESMLDGMSLEDAQFAIPAIKYSRRQLRTYIVYGSKFTAAVSASDRRKAERIGKRIELSSASDSDFKPPRFDRDDQFDGFPTGLLDDEERD